MATAIGGGIISGFMAMPLLFNVLPQSVKDQRKFLGAIHVILGLVVASAMKNKNLKTVGYVLAGTGIYDLIAQNIDIGLPGLPTSNTLISKAIPSSTPVSASYYPALASSYEPSRNLSASYEPVSASYAPEALAGTNPYDGIWD
jgi:hypothetical protein